MTTPLFMVDMSGLKLAGTIAVTVALQLLISIRTSAATPTVRASLVSLSSDRSEVLHATIRTQEGLERFVFAPRGSPTTDTNETHYGGYARTRNFQKDRLPASLTLTDSRAWLFFTSRRTGRPVASIISLTASDSRLRASKVRVSRTPQRTLGCGSHAGESDHAPAFERARTSRRTNRSVPSPLTAEGVQTFSPPRVLEVATEADFSFYQIHGNETNSYIRAVLNAVDVIYTSSIGIRLKVVSQRVASTNPGSLGTISALNLLESFRLSPSASSSQADVRHLFTGREIEGLTIGIAYVGAVCTANGKYGVGLSNSVGAGLQPYLAAHEIAHNLSAVHDQDPQSIMNPAITEANNRFAQPTLASIYNFVSTTGSCIASETLSNTKLQVDSTDPSRFAANVSFITLLSDTCKVTLYGSADTRRFIPLATRSIKATAPGTTTEISFSADSPPLTTPQTFLFKTKVSCGSARQVSPATRFRYAFATSSTSRKRNGQRWLESLRRNFRS
jgi:hypothetical protein